MLKVTYLDHSAFAFETADMLLLFDCASNAAMKLANPMAIKRLMLGQGRVMVFASHAHGDHYNPQILELKQWGDVDFIFSSDIDGDVASEDVHKLMPGSALTVNGVSVMAAGSTDVGVSFIVHHAGYCIFHAGDLNWWHWRAESTLREMVIAEQDFKVIVDGLKGIQIDVACFPVDPRLGDFYYAGADYFAQTIKPKVMFPMHFWDRPDAATRFQREADYYGVKVITLTQPGSAYAYETAL